MVQLRDPEIEIEGSRSWYSRAREGPTRAIPEKRRHVASGHKLKKPKNYCNWDVVC
jgi:hypothetical protein